MTDLLVIHLKGFARMANLVLAWTVSTPNFSPIMDYLVDLQNLLRSPPATAQLGAKCLKFLQARWFYMVDTLRFISNHFTLVSEFLCNLPDDAAFPRYLPHETFELCLVILAFSCFTTAVEGGACSLPEIVSIGFDRTGNLAGAPRKCRDRIGPIAN
jgi:hypothetical protein